MWVELTSVDDEKILINLNHVEAIMPSGQEKHTNISLAGQNQAYYVKESIKEIKEMIPTVSTHNKQGWQ